MATCATLGEAAGTAAALCLAKDTTPRGLYAQHRETLVQTLLRRDASVLGIPNTDPHDLARRATVNASSYMPNISILTPAVHRLLEHDLGITVPVEGALGTVEVLIDCLENTELTLEIYTVSKPQNFVPHEKILEKTVEVVQQECGWLGFEVGLEALEPQNLFLVLKANPAVRVHLSPTPLSGVLCYVKELAKTSGDANEGLLPGKPGRGHSRDSALPGSQKHCPHRSLHRTLNRTVRRLLG